MMNIKFTSLVMAGLLSGASIATFAASSAGPDTKGSKSGATSSPILLPSANNPAAPSGGNTRSGSASGSSSGSAGGNSGSGAGGGTGAAGGGTGGAGGGTGSWTGKSSR